MNNTFLKDHVYMNIPKKYSQELEELIGDINDVLESKIGMRICYDKNDSHMDHSTKPEEDCFSGFAILRDDQNEADDKEIISSFKPVAQALQNYVQHELDIITESEWFDDLVENKVKQQLQKSKQ